ncbi:MAG: hypothetical protein B7Z31_15820 [Rhodobacterales bacterium 12-65-15]|nr:MAG: hypothetical protein B7Z31_15820 [Rhodobacterales bacterium 12-65-15]
MGRRARQRPRRAVPDAYSVALTPGALSDLDRLDTFLRVKNPSAADRMLKAFDTLFAQMGENPYSSPVFRQTILRTKMVRFGQRAYICIYDVRERNVVVARIFHTLEDWQTSFDDQTRSDFGSTTG